MAIRTRPPMSLDDIGNLISEIENDGSSHTDGKILSRLIKLTFHSTLKKMELINLSIRDVADDNGRIRDVIQRTKGGVHLSGEAKKVIRDTLKNLTREKNYQITPDSPLFPDTSGARYSDRKLSRHIEKYVGKHSKRTLEKIKQTGICRYYESVEAQLTDKQRLKATAEFADLSEKQVLGIIKGKIQPEGKRKPLVGEDPIDKLNKRDQWSELDLGDVILNLETFDPGDQDRNTAFKEAFGSAVDRSRALSDEQKRLFKDSFLQSFPRT